MYPKQVAMTKIDLFDIDLKIQLLLNRYSRTIDENETNVS